MRWAKWVAAVSAAPVLFLGMGSPSWGAAHEIKVVMTEYKFEPNRIEVRAGDTVTLTLVNATKQKKPHEFMIGRKVKMGGPFKNRPESFHRDFFHGMKVKYHGGEKVQMLMAGEAELIRLKPMKMKMEMGGKKHGDKDDHGSKKMEMGKGERKDMGHGFMVQLHPQGTAKISFTVPADKAGEWEIACFSKDGTHYKEKMRGTLVVKK